MDAIPCSMGVGCDEYGVCYAAAHGRPEMCPAEEQYPGQAPCPVCFESSGYMVRIVSATWDDPAYAEADPTRRCEECNGTGTVNSPLATLDDLEELAFEEAAAESR